MQQRSRRRAGRRINPIVLAVYDNVHMALWATLITALTFLGVFGIPVISGVDGRYRVQRTRAMEAEDSFYCNRWGMGAGKRNHEICMSDLRQFRRSVETQLADEIFF